MKITDMMEICTGFRASNENNAFFKAMEVFLQCYSVELNLPVTIYDSSSDCDLLKEYISKNNFKNVKVINFIHTDKYAIEPIVWDFAIRRTKMPYIFLSHIDCYPINKNVFEYFSEILENKIVLVSNQDISCDGRTFDRIFLPSIGPSNCLVNVEKWKESQASWCRDILIEKENVLYDDFVLKYDYALDGASMLAPYLKLKKFKFSILRTHDIFRHFHGMGRVDTREDFQNFYFSKLKKECGSYNGEKVENDTIIFDTFKEFLLNNSIPIEQHPFEFDRFLDKCSKIEPKIICEIGSSYGGSLYGFSTILKNNGKLISIDISTGENEVISKKIKSKNKITNEIRNNGIMVHMIEENSSVAEKKIKEILEDDKIDVLFIDGDHNMVKEDFEMYKKHVRHGGIIAFHNSLNDNTAVPKYLLYELGYDDLVTIGYAAGINAMGISFLYKKECD